MRALLVIAGLLVVGCTQQAPTPEPPVAGSAELVNLDCDTANSFGVISGVVRNTGQTVIEGATAFLVVDGSTVSAPVLTTRLPPGSLGEFMHSIGQARAVTECRVTSLQDSAGRDLL